MAISRSWLWYGLLIIICISLLIDHAAEARGGRGGGGRGGGRGSGRGTGRGTSRGTRSRSSYGGGTRYGGLHFQAAVAAGYIYGYTSYTRRSRYHRSPSSEPSICRNTYDFIMSNGTHWEFFVCPRASEPDSHTYCCGPSNRQKCCSFWQDGGRVAGAIFGLLIFVSLIGIVVYCCCRKQPSPKKGEVIALCHQPNKGHYTLTNSIPPPEAMPPEKPFGPQSNVYPPMYPAQPYQPPDGAYPPPDGAYPPGGVPPLMGPPGMPPPGMPMPGMGPMAGDGMPPMYAPEPGMPPPNPNSPYPPQPYPIDPTPYPTNPHAYPSDPTPYPAGPGYPAGLPPPGYRETAEYPAGPLPPGPGYPTAPANV